MIPEKKNLTISYLWIAQEMANRAPAPTWDDKVEEFSDTFAGNVAAGVTMLNPFTLSGVSMKTMADMMFRDMTLTESLAETGEFAKGYNQSGLKMAGNTVIGFVTMPDTIAELSDQVIEQDLTNTSKNMVNATLSGLKDRYHEDFINGDARSRGEYVGDALTVVGDVALTVMGAGKVFRVGDAASDIAKVGKLADTFDDISDTARTIDKIEDITDEITDISKVEDATSAVSTKTIQNVSELSNEQMEALIKYTGDDYVNINNSLRGMDSLTPENQVTVETMKSALDNSALPQDMTLYRGTSIETLGSLQNLSVDELVGKTFTEKGFMSTSTNNVVAEGFSGNMQMTIEATKGARALDISSISQYTTEAEVLFNAGQEMLITSAEVKNGILHITVIIE